jgi:uncharacterized protein
MGRAEGVAALSVVVVYSPRAGEVDEVQLALPAGACVGDAIEASGLTRRHVGLDTASLRIGVWGRLKLQATDLLRDQDRVEIYRPLTVDPKEARRLRYRQHRERYAAK